MVDSLHEYYIERCPVSEAQLIHLSEQAGLQIMFCTCVREMPHSNLSWNTGCPDWELSSFSSVLPGKCRLVYPSGHDRFLPDSFQFIIHLSSYDHTLYSMSQEEGSIFWEVIVPVIISKKVYMYMCPILNDFRGRAISRYISKIVDKKEILRTVSNTGIYYSSDKVGTVYLV
jgi:hypothetical protein